MLFLKRYVFFLFLGYTLLCPVYANTDHLTQPYSKHTIQLIPRAYIAYQKKVWREIDLEKKPNSSCFIRGKEISKLLIEAAKQKHLTPYQDDRLETPMSYESFLKNLQLPTQKGQTSSEEFYPSEISTLGLVEYIIVNKITARQEYHIESIQCIVPGKKNAPTHLDHIVAAFKYKDVVNYFKTLPFEEIIWYTDGNNAQYLTWLDAFELRLFSSKIIKLDNPDDATISEIYHSNTTKSEDPSIISQKIEEKIDIEISDFLSEY